jgi:hypothetical protein
MITRHYSRKSPCSKSVRPERIPGFPRPRVLPRVKPSVTPIHWDWRKPGPPPQMFFSLSDWDATCRITVALSASVYDDVTSPF